MSVRYAPSPTGTLHVGNLRTAVIANLWAKHLGAPLVIRYEDIDRERARDAFRKSQREDLVKLGVWADREELQSQFGARHFDYFRRALVEGAIYPCFASRKQVAAALENIASAPHGPAPLYDGQWRDRRDYPAASVAGASTAASPTSLNWRFRAPEPDGSQDLIVARTEFRPALWNGEGIDSDVTPESLAFVPAYNWACALDDYRLRPRLLVRAWDLASVAESQRRLQAMFARLDGDSGYVVPAVFHASLLVDERGRRLEKRSQGVTLAELESRGLAPAELRKKLEQSFAPTNLRDFKVDELFGEAERELTLEL